MLTQLITGTKWRPSEKTAHARITTVLSDFKQGELIHNKRIRFPFYSNILLCQRAPTIRGFHVFTRVLRGSVGFL